MVKTAILGGGLAGLSAAYHLEQAGYTDYQLFEKESEAGGQCRSFEIEGFTFDYAIHVWYSQDRYTGDLVGKKLLAGNLNSQIRKAFIYFQGRLTEYPFQAHLFGQDPEIIRECLLGLIAAKYEASSTPTNFKEWIYTTFGKGIAEYFMLPYNTKLWAVDPGKMAFDWAAERVPVPELRTVLDGALKPPSLQFGHNSRFGYPLKGGIGSLPRSFLPYLRNLNLNSEVVKISTARKEIEIKGKPLKYDKIIAAVPLPVLASLLAGELTPEVKTAFDNLDYNSEFIVSLAVDRPRISDCHWIYFPESQFVFHRVHFPLNLSCFNGVEGQSSLTVEISVSKYKSLRMTEQQIIEKVIEGLLESNLITRNDRILFKDIRCISPAYIIMTNGMAGQVKLIHDFLENKDIFPCGRYAKWQYWNMDQAILDGKKIAERITGQAVSST
jgi:protoporphyrinogen oxidase